MIAGLAASKRVALAHLSTPLEYLPELSRLSAGRVAFVKHDDWAGLTSRGNGTRKLEYVLADALAIPVLDTRGS